MTVPVDDPNDRDCWNRKRRILANHWNHFRPNVTEYSFLDRIDALRTNYICNSSVFAKASAVQSAPAATRQLFQYEDWVQWTLLSTKGPFVYTPEPLTGYRLHPESSSYPIYQNFLRHLYSSIEFLMTLHVLTDDAGIRARTQSELLYNLARIAAIYADRSTGESAASPSQSPQSIGQFAESFWESSVLQLQSQVDELNDRVRTLSERLHTIRSSTAYQSLVKVRNFINKITNRSSLT